MGKKKINKYIDHLSTLTNARGEVELISKEAGLDVYWVKVCLVDGVTYAINQIASDLFLSDIKVDQYIRHKMLLIKQADSLRLFSTVRALKSSKDNWCKSREEEDLESIKQQLVKYADTLH